MFFRFKLKIECTNRIGKLDFQTFFFGVERPAFSTMLNVFAQAFCLSKIFRFLFLYFFAAFVLFS
jgi:hypothetical protein